MATEPLSDSVPRFLRWTAGTAGDTIVFEDVHGIGLVARQFLGHRSTQPDAPPAPRYASSASPSTPHRS